jgi:ABC-type branched-subunit amino acid transport system ATPase component
LLVEHDVDLVFSVCDQIVGLDAGQVIARGTPAEVRHSPALIAAYLGVADDPAQTTPASGSPA